MKVGFVSLGCAKNLVDSEQIMGMLRSYNHTIVPKPEDADVIVVNTCGFIAPAKEESIDTIFEMAQYKEKNPGKRVISFLRRMSTVRCILPYPTAFMWTA